MMRVVVDSNILASSAHNSTGPTAEVLNRVRASEHVLIVSTIILEEIARALSYPRFRRYHALSDEEIARIVADVEAASIVIDTPAEGLDRVILDDPDDDHVVAAAVDGGADVICTRNKKHFAHADVIAYCRQWAIEDELFKLIDLFITHPPSDYRFVAHCPTLTKTDSAISLCSFRHSGPPTPLSGSSSPTLLFPASVLMLLSGKLCFVDSETSNSRINENANKRFPTINKRIPGDADASLIFAGPIVASTS